jgi:flavin reductase (DIM6/NTAB) family NADH-FMN oxidoreductase RutF
MTVNADTFRSVFRRYATGVVVITASAGGPPAGLTATSLASVSLDPPLLSFAVSESASTWPAFAAAGSIVVNFLDADQHHIATRFATSGIDRFAAPTAWSRLASGEPVLDDAPSHLRAQVTHRLPVGDHVIVVARVVDAAGTAAPSTAPLVYHAGAYGTVAPAAVSTP